MCATVQCDIHPSSILPPPSNRRRRPIYPKSLMRLISSHSVALGLRLLLLSPSARSRSSGLLLFLGSSFFKRHRLRPPPPIPVSVPRFRKRGSHHVEVSRLDSFCPILSRLRSTPFVVANSWRILTVPLGSSQSRPLFFGSLFLAPYVAV